MVAANVEFPEPILPGTGIAFVAYRIKDQRVYAATL